MFQFPGFAQNPYLIQGLVPHYDNWKPKTACHHTASEFQLSEVGFPIQKSTDQSLFAAPHGLSQRTTSFIASQCQGIHRTPLRHLIALMIDAHPSAEVAHTRCAMGHRRNKTSLLHDLTRTGGQARSHGRERFGHGNSSNAEPPHDRTGQITSSRCRTTRRSTRWRNGKTLSHLRTASWWSQTGSNRRPHACKARALPAELWPLQETRDTSNVTTLAAMPKHRLSRLHRSLRIDETWWAWEDLNFRPHAYQARALTN
jgi:hypothetical protein